jgi:hypothetical protein
VFPVRPEDDDDLAGLVQTTLGPFRLERRVAGPSPGEVGDVNDVSDVGDAGDVGEVESPSSANSGHETTKSVASCEQLSEYDS